MGFKGVLQVDGYAGYRPLADTGGVRLAFCWTHVRRRYYELAAAGPFLFNQTTTSTSTAVHQRAASCDRAHFCYEAALRDTSCIG